MTDAPERDLEHDLAQHLRARAGDADPTTEPGPRIMAEAARLRTRRRRSITAVVGVVLVLAVAGGVVFAQRSSTTSSDVVTVGEGVTGPAGARRYTAIGSLLESSPEPLRLCVGGGGETDDLRPSDVAGVPRCGTNVPLLGVDLSDLPGVATKTWQDQTFSTSPVVVVGTWDGTSLTATEPVVVSREPTPPPSPTPSFSVPCPEPPNGWPSMPTDVTGYTGSIGALKAYEDAHADYAGSWVGPDQTIMVEAFTGDLATHHAELSAIYPRICVIQGTRTMVSLKSIQQQLTVGGLPDGNRILSSGTGLDQDRAAGPFVVQVALLIDDPEIRAWLHDRYGDAVQVEGGPITQVS